MKQCKKGLLAATLTTLTLGTAMADNTDGQWRGQAGAALNTTSGNTSTQNLLLNLDVARQTEADKISVVGSVNEGKSDVDGQSTTTAGKWSLAGQYDYNLTPDWFGFGKLGFDHDRVIDLSLRTLVGAGLGWHVLKSEPHTFDVYGGLSQTHTRYGHAELIDGDNKTSFRTTGLLLGENSAHRLTDTVSFNQRLEVYPAVSGTRSTLAKFNASLSVAMTSTLSLNVGVVQSYNSKPADGVRKLDSSFFTGINVKLGQ